MSRNYKLNFILLKNPFKFLIKNKQQKKIARSTSLKICHANNNRTQIQIKPNMATISVIFHLLYIKLFHLHLKKLKNI